MVGPNGLEREPMCGREQSASTGFERCSPSMQQSIHSERSNCLLGPLLSLLLRAGPGNAPRPHEPTGSGSARQFWQRAAAVYS